MKTIIVGSGLGGLVTALRLAKKGYKVEVVEKFNQPGGRLNKLQKDGFTFDMAPSFFSMSYTFKELMNECNIDMPFTFHSLDPLYSVNIKGIKETFTIYKDVDKLAEIFEPYEPGFKKKMEKYLKSAEITFHDTIDRVVRRNFNSIFDYIAALSTVPFKHIPKVMRTYMAQLDKHFESDVVKQILSLTAFFLGATPYDTPAIYTLLSYTEFKHDGYYNVKGGMYKIVEGLMDLLEKEGVEFHFNTEITELKYNGKEVVACVDNHGNNREADVFVINADAASFRGEILGRKRYRTERLDKMKWTLAPLTIYLGIDSKISSINHHNYYLGDNFKEYAAKIFKNLISFDRPYYYVNAISKFNPESAPKGCESLFILVPVPDLRFKPNWENADEMVEAVIKDLSERIDFDIKKHIISKTVYTPKFWEKTFNLYRGSGLGLAHDLSQIGAFRPSNRDEKFENLFYVGASTVPGTGLPMTIISSELVTKRIVEKYGTISS